MDNSIDTSNQPFTKHNQESDRLSITAEQLKSKIEVNQPLMVFDIGEQTRYKKKHIPNSSFAVCNEESKKNIMPKLPKDIEIILVDEDENYPKQIAEMMQELGLTKTKYLKGGFDTWKWDFVGTDFKDNDVETDISAQALKESLDKNQNNNLFLLDVRQPEEFAEWNIENSVNIPLSEISKKDALNKIPKDKEVITICPRGNRSTIGKYLLQRYGYNVKSLEGGLKSWSISVEYGHKEFEIANSKVNLSQVRRIGKGCISYIIESDREAAVIDPVFPIDNYIIEAKRLGATITKVFDTHLHADHISAAKSLAEKVKAVYYQSAYEQYEDKDNQNSSLSIDKLKDGDVQNTGATSLKVVHTPGHTPGSLSFLIGDKMLFTGDTLFIDSIGRPDLRDNAKEFTGNLYDSLQQKIMKMPGNILILPSHFEKDIENHTLLTSTLRETKEKSPFLNPNITKDEFVKNISSKVMDTAPPPSYKEIISINSGKKSIQSSSLSDVFDLEIGPNRCSV